MVDFAKVMRDKKAAKLVADDTLAVKYRARTLEDLVGQDDVVSQINGMIKRGRIPRTMLITGDTGVGKTTVARIIARTINGFPPELERHQDIIEINASDERKIEDIRNLIQQIKFLPSRGKFKIYIIDECHMLTQQAASALLKPLEEPPEHVVWILATNEPYRLLQTIRDRAETLSLRRPQPKELYELLARVAKAEKAFYPPAAYKPIYKAVAQASGGTPRNALAIFGRLMNMHADKPIVVSDEKDIEVAMRDAIKTLDVGVEKVAALILLSMYQGKAAALTAVGDTEDYQNLAMQLLDLNAYVMEKAAAIARPTWTTPARSLLTKHMGENNVKPNLALLAMIQSGLVELRQRILMSTTADRHVMLAGVSTLLVQARGIIGKKDKGDE